MTRICIFPQVEGIGGGASFRLKFESGLKARGIEVTHNPADSPDAILVLAGTRHLLPLLQARRRGVKIVQRLNGINWVHRKKRTGLRHFIRAEYGNANLAYIRKGIATGVIYQSHFAKEWWQDWYGRTRVLTRVVHNGVDLDAYTFEGAHSRPTESFRLLVVEGSHGGGYELGLDNAVRLAEILRDRHGFPMELMVVGKITDEHRERVSAGTEIPLLWEGAVPRERIPEIDRSAHLFFSADLNAACPNAVIEALACGLPVASFDTGALRELVPEQAGAIVPYGADVWKLEPPDMDSLAEASAEILREQDRFRAGARQAAEKNLGLERMVSAYLGFLS
jgi:glycosyltransferase involved in cell wall biosynthesis